MQEYIFRGKSKWTGKWIEGDLRSQPEWATAIRHGHPHHVVEPVYPKSVGMFTGLLDKNGKRIFEGDAITGLFYFEESVEGIVGLADGSFGVAWWRGDVLMFTPFSSTCNVVWEVVGNSYDKEA